LVLVLQGTASCPACRERKASEGRRLSRTLEFVVGSKDLCVWAVTETKGRIEKEKKAWRGEEKELFSD
jgi:hypothetical protein